jgi:hypothetical protein
MSGRFPGVVALLLALAAACDDSGEPPSRAGDLTVSYFQGGPSAGALLLTITGGEVQNVTAANGEQVSFASPSPGTTRVVVIGNLGTGTLLRIRVPDVTLASRYVVATDQVADKVTFSLIDPERHPLTISP